MCVESDSEVLPVCVESDSEVLPVWSLTVRFYLCVWSLTVRFYLCGVTPIAIEVAVIYCLFLNAFLHVANNDEN